MDGLMDQIFSEDPYLAFQPAFAYTLPIQLLVSGITLTLLCVLAIHLICEARPIYRMALQELTNSHDTIPLPPGTPKLHSPILFNPHSPHISLHKDNLDITTFGRFSGYVAI